VYVFTAIISIWAYVWLIIILQVVTPNVVDIWEAVITFISFPALVYVAYLIDEKKFDRCCHGARISVASAQMRLSRYGSAKFVMDKIRIKRGSVQPDLIEPREAVSLLRVLRPDTSRLTEREIVEIGASRYGEGQGRCAGTGFIRYRRAPWPGVTGSGAAVIWDGPFGLGLLRLGQQARVWRCYGVGL
jgi:solute carrier family 8 (sodium/calcium exchanger)